ncbi:MAG: hypothetical protein ABL309_13860 [Phycisphaerales bacterium]
MSKTQLRSEPAVSGNVTEIIELDVTSGNQTFDPPITAVMLESAGTIDVLGRDNDGPTHITTPPLPAGVWIGMVLTSIASTSAVKTGIVGR